MKCRGAKMRNALGFVVVSLLVSPLANAQLVPPEVSMNADTRVEQNKVTRTFAYAGSAEFVHLSEVAEAALVPFYVEGFGKRAPMDPLDASLYVKEMLAQARSLIIVESTAVLAYEDPSVIAKNDPPGPGEPTIGDTRTITTCGPSGSGFATQSWTQEYQYTADSNNDNENDFAPDWVTTSYRWDAVVECPPG